MNPNRVRVGLLGGEKRPRRGMARPSLDPDTNRRRTHGAVAVPFREVDVL